MSNISNNNKVIIIGIDGATFNLIQPLLDKDELPFFQKLITKSSYGRLKSTLPLNGAAAWTSFFSGKNPGKHNIYNYMNYNGSDLCPKLITNKSIKSPLIWDIMNQYSLKSIFLNVPIISKPVKVNGIMISGLLTPKDQPFVYPVNFINELIKQDYKIDPGPLRYFDDNDYYNHVLEILAKQQTTFLNLIQNNPWDLAVIILDAFNRFQQTFWHDEKKIHSIYQQLDSFLSQVYKSLDEETYFIVLSNYGFKTITKKFFINEWLWELGLLKRNITTDQPRITEVDDIIYNHSNGKNPLITSLLTRSGLTKKNIRTILPNSVSEMLKHAVPSSIRRLFHREYLHIEWKKTKAYFISQHLQGININLKGREPYGTIEPGTEYEKLRERIISELYHLKDPYTFEHVIDEVFRKEDLFSGNYLDGAPDILIVPKNYQYYLDGDKRTSHLCIGSAKDDYPINANFDPNGIFFISGPTIKSGKNITDASIYDLIPTILYIMGLQENDNLDGKVLSQIFNGFYSNRQSTRSSFITARDILEIV